MQADMVWTFGGSLSVVYCNAMTTTWVSVQKPSGAKARARKCEGKEERRPAAGMPCCKSQRTTEVKLLWWEPKVEQLWAKKKLIFLSSIHCSGSFQRKISQRQAFRARSITFKVKIDGHGRRHLRVQGFLLFTWEILKLRVILFLQIKTGKLIYSNYNGHSGIFQTPKEETV